MLRPSLSLAIFGTIGTAVICGFAAAWLFDLSTLEGMLLGAIISSTDGAAIFALLARIDPAAQARAHARGRGRLQRPGRRPARDRASSSGSSRTRLRRAGHGAAVRAQRWGSARWSAWASGWLGGAGPARRASSRARGSTRWPRSPPPASRSAAPHTLHGSGFLAAYLAGLALGSARIPAKQTVIGLPRGPRLGGPDRRCSSRSDCSSSRASSTRSGWRGPRSRSLLVFIARPLTAALATAFEPLHAPGSGVVLGWAGLRGAVPVVLATFPVIEGLDPDTDVLQHRLLRRRDLDAAPGRHRRVARPQARRDHERARAPAPAHGDRHGAAPRARRSWSTRWARTMRSWDSSCASWGCRATRC